MEQNRMIIVEGPQGTGKSSLTTYLRDNKSIIFQMSIIL